MIKDLLIYKRNFITSLIISAIELPMKYTTVEPLRKEITLNTNYNFNLSNSRKKPPTTSLNINLPNIPTNAPLLGTSMVNPFGLPYLNVLPKL